MRVLRLPVVPQLCHRPLLAIRNEDRVVAEALVAARLVRDPAVERAGAAELAAVGREENELRDVARAAFLDACELAEKLRDRRRTFWCVAGGQDARAAAERLDLEARVLR
jgi:hypothetical protein